MIALQSDTYSDDFANGASRIRVDGLSRFHCTNCGANSMSSEQVRANQLRIADAKRAGDNLLYGEQIRGLREKLGLSQTDAALLFGGGSTGFSKYERGQVVQSVPMDRLLRLVDENPHLLNSLRRIATGGSWNVLSLTPIKSPLSPVSVATSATLTWVKSTMIASDVSRQSNWEKLGEACNDDSMAKANFG
jgi:putative zinc finger/helix-turn-helix YgiT family protein